MNTKNITPYEIALGGYFKSKNNYEKKMKSNINRIIEQNLLTSKSKLKDIIRELKGKCIGCKKQVNTIFEIKNRIYIARCGNESNPCKLNIQIERPNTVNLFEQLSQFRKLIEENQISIVKLKYSMLFELLNNNDDDAYIKQFEIVNSEYNSNNIAYNNILEHLNENIEKNKQIDLKNEKLDVDFNIHLSQFKECINQFNITHHKNYIKDALGIYLNFLKPILIDIRTNKCKNNIIETSTYQDIDDDNYDELIFYKCIPYNTNNIEYSLNEPKFKL